MERKSSAGNLEAEIYKALGLQFIEPELREGRGEIALAATNKLPKLVTDRDILGILHAHTDRSDGVQHTGADGGSDAQTRVPIFRGRRPFPSQPIMPGGSRLRRLRNSRPRPTD